MTLSPSAHTSPESVSDRCAPATVASGRCSNLSTDSAPFSHFPLDSHLHHHMASAHFGVQCVRRAEGTEAMLRVPVLQKARRLYRPCRAPPRASRPEEEGKGRRGAEDLRPARAIRRSERANISGTLGRLRNGFVIATTRCAGAKQPISHESVWCRVLGGARSTQSGTLKPKDVAKEFQTPQRDRCCVRYAPTLTYAVISVSPRAWGEMRRTTAAVSKKCHTVVRVAANTRLADDRRKTK